MQTDPLQKAFDKALKDEADLLQQLEVVQGVKKYLQQLITAPSSTKDGSSTLNYTKEYDATWSDPTKFQFLLKKEDRFLHFRQAGELIVSLEGKGDAKDIGARLSANCHPLKRDGVIVKYKVGKSNVGTFWGSPKWLDENGKIKDGHQPNEDILNVNKKNEPTFEI